MQREERKKRYIKDFTKAFTENGIDKTSIKKLAKAADINEASIYQYFKNKDDIIVECIRQYFESMKETLFPVLTDRSRTADERLAFISSYSKAEAGHCGFVCQVLANPLYSPMCRPIISGFASWMNSVGESLSKESGINEDDMLPLVFLFFNVFSYSRILGDGSLFTMQLDFLKGILKSKLRYSAEKQPAESAGRGMA